MSLEAAIGSLGELLTINNDLLKQLIDGRTEALASLRGADAGDKPARRTRAPKADATPAAEPEAAPAPAAPKAKKFNPKIDDENVRTYLGDWMGSTDDKEERTKRGTFVKSVMDHFGSSTFVGETGIPAENRKEALFYIERFRNGLTADFSADYDFDVDPLSQGDLEPVPEEPAATDEDYNFG